VPASLRRATFVALPATALAAALVPWPPTLVERVFSSTVYPAIQPPLTSLTNLVPIACLDLLLAAAVVTIVARARASWSTRPGVVAWGFLLLARGVRAAAVAYLVFLGGWGLNYHRAPAAQRLSVDESRITALRLRALVARCVEEVNRLASTPRDAGRLEWPHVVANLGPAFAEATRVSGTAWHVAPGWPKPSLVGRAFPAAAVDGMVNPFGLEVVLNPEVLPFERPFVLAHEWAHLAGHAHESEASFVGLLACLHGTAEARYSGWQALLIHASRGLPADERRAALDRLSPAASADLQAIAHRVGRAQPLVRRVSWQIYDRYLRANRVEDGVASYDGVTRLMLGSRLTASLGDAAVGSRPPKGDLR
jgi:hypothetical protein